MGTMKEYSDRLLECLLRAHRPDKYRERYQVQVGADGASFVEALQRARERVRTARRMKELSVEASIGGGSRNE